MYVAVWQPPRWVLHLCDAVVPAVLAAFYIRILLPARAVEAGHVILVLVSVALVLRAALIPSSVARTVVVGIFGVAGHIGRRATHKLFMNVDKAFATVYYHRFFLIQPAPFPETVLGNSAEFVLGQRVFRGLVPQVVTAEAYAEYLRHYQDPATLHAMCEDYRRPPRQSTSSMTRPI